MPRPDFRSLLWSASRRVYMHARGEGRNEMTTNGELDLQHRALDTAPADVPLVVLDVGANYGLWTLASADRAGLRPDARFVAFEPIPSIHDALVARLAAHPAAARLHVVRAALSDAPGTAEMSVSTGGNSSLGVAFAGAEATAATVDVNTLDLYCAAEGIERVRLVKCDAEGFDFEVVRGSRRMFDEERIDLFQFEYNHRWMAQRWFLRDVFERFRGTPYAVGKICAGRIEVYDEWHPEMERFFEANYLIAHRRALPDVAPQYGRVGRRNAWRALA